MIYRYRTIATTTLYLCGCIKMANYEEPIVELTNTQLNKLKSEAKNETILKQYSVIIKKMQQKLQDEEPPRKLLLSTRQINKIRNVFNKNISTDIKLSRAELSKTIQSGGFPCKLMSNFGKKAVFDLAIPLAKYHLPEIASNLV